MLLSTACVRAGFDPTAADAADTADTAAADSSDAAEDATLLVHLQGYGVVIVAPSNTVCLTDCTVSLLSGTPVTLTPIALGGRHFAGWSGACSNVDSCSLLIGAGSQSVTARFEYRTDKFLPTMVVKYGSPNSGVQSAATTARFDLLLTTTNHNQVWSTDTLNSWHMLKSLNPDMVILLETFSPNFYDTNDWHSIGLGWDWMKANHGIGSVDRWIEVGETTGDYLTVQGSSTTYAMRLGSEAWRTYWHTSHYDGLWGGMAPQAGADGLYAYDIGCHPGNWYTEGTSTPDLRADYTSVTGHNSAAWEQDMKQLYAEVIPALGSKGLVLTTGVESTSCFETIDNLPVPPFGMSCAFTTLYGEGSYTIGAWSDEVARLRDVKNMVMLCNNPNTVATGSGLAKMDVVATAGNMGPTTGWQALWFGMTSFLLAMNSERSNGFFGFSVWENAYYHFFDEFDAKHLHLGDPQGPAVQVGLLHLREYTDGWVVVNPSDEAVSGGEVPSGRVRVLNHENLLTTESASLVTSFDLGAFRGAILLKEGRQAGDEDNP